MRTSGGDRALALRRKCLAGNRLRRWDEPTKREEGNLIRFHVSKLKTITMRGMMISTFATELAARVVEMVPLSVWKLDESPTLIFKLVRWVQFRKPNLKSPKYHREIT